MKRVFSLLLAAVIVLSCGCGESVFRTVAASYANGIDALKGSGTGSRIVHADVVFSDLPDEVPNISLEIARTEELLFRIDRGELSGKRAAKALSERTNAYRNICTAASIAYVRYCLDVTDAVRKKAYDLMSVQLDTWNGLLIEAERKLASDPALKGSYSEAGLMRLEKADSLHDPSIRPLAARERELIGAYETLASTFTVSDGGREWTAEEILSDPSLTYEAFMDLYEAYQRAYNTASGAIFLELIDVRNRIARICGYPSYAEYGYASYNRDYSAQDAQRLAERIRQTIVPLFSDMQAEYYGAWMRLCCGTFYRDASLPRIQTAATRILEELSEPWTYMVEHQMFDLENTNNRMQGSYTTYFPSYGAPFLFSSWDDSYSMPTTLLHEFGHYASYYFNGEDAFGCESMDLAEADSQGLEMLAISQYDLLYGALSDAAETVSLFNALYVVISGCMEDLFQQYAYHTDGVTTEMLNREYERLCDAFGLKDLGLSALSWTEVPHTFQQPMYYISYCAGMLAALELYGEGERAADAYSAILHRDKDAEFRTLMMQIGLSDPIDPDTVDAVAEIVKQSYARVADRQYGREGQTWQPNGTTIANGGICS